MQYPDWLHWNRDTKSWLWKVLCIGPIICTKKCPHLNEQITCKMLVISFNILEPNAAKLNRNKSVSVKWVHLLRSECQELFTSSIYMIHNCSQPQIKHHKKVKMKTQNILNFLFWNSLFPLYKNLCWNFPQRQQWIFRTFYIFLSLSKKINHSVNYIVLLSSLAGVRPRGSSPASHYSQMLPVFLGSLSYKLSKECLHWISEVPPGGYDSINFHKLL